MQKRVMIGALAALMAPVQAIAADAKLPSEPWPHAVACSGALFLTAENLNDAEDQSDDTRQVADFLSAAFDTWYDRAQSLPGYSSDRFMADLQDYIEGPLGSGEGALDTDTRAANLGVCVNELIKPE